MKTRKQQNLFGGRRLTKNTKTCWTTWKIHLGEVVKMIGLTSWEVDEVSKDQGHSREAR